MLYCFQDNNYRLWQSHLHKINPASRIDFLITISAQELKQARKQWPQAICFGIYEISDHRDPVDAWLSLGWDWVQIESILLRHGSRNSEKNQQRIFLKDLLSQEQDLVNRKKTIDGDFKVQKSQNKQATTNIKRLDQFFEAVAKCENLEGLLLLLTKELKKEDPAIELFLWLNEPEKNSRLFWLERKKIKTTWTTYCDDEQQVPVALAQTLGRPVRKIFCEPIKVLDLSGYFIFECDKKQNAETELRKIINQFLNVLEPVIEHFILTEKRSLMVTEWQTVFNCLNDGMVLLNDRNEILATNYKYQTLDESRKEHLKKITYPVSSNTRLEIYRDQQRIVELKAQIAQKEKMVQLGELATDLAHELNNPLTGIKSTCQLMLADGLLGEQEQDDIREILMAVDRSHEIIRNLLDFAAEEVLPTEIVSLKDLLNSTTRLLKVALHEHSLQMEVPREDCYVKAQPQLLQQVLFNLLINACQAMPERGKIRIWIEKKNKKIFLYIKDNGYGISAENVKKIFEPFYTTKSKSEGTGLGLSLSREIIRRFDGDIGVESEEGKGATFWFYLKEVDRP